MRVIGLDPGLRRTGWGVIEALGSRLRHVANGTVPTDPKASLAARLLTLHEGLAAVLDTHRPDEAAVETTLANRNATATIKLGMARGVALLGPALAGLPVTEYLPTVVKRSVVGTGHAAKEQVAMMVARLLPGCVLDSADAADALAVAICHAHTAASSRLWRAAQDATAAGAGGR